MPAAARPRGEKSPKRIETTPMVHRPVTTKNRTVEPVVRTIVGWKLTELRSISLLATWASYPLRLVKACSFYSVLRPSTMRGGGEPEAFEETGGYPEASGRLGPS